MSREAKAEGGTPEDPPKYLEPGYQAGGESKVEVGTPVDLSTDPDAWVKAEQGDKNEDKSWLLLLSFWD